MKKCIFAITLLLLIVCGSRITLFAEDNENDINYGFQTVDFDASVLSVGDEGLIDGEVRSGNYPSYYSLVSLNQTTSVKDQGDFGTCWAFSAISSAESNLLKTGKVNDKNSIDLSEFQMAYYAYNKVNDPLSLTQNDQITYDGYINYLKTHGYSVDSIFDLGGNMYLSAILLANGIGVVEEEDFSIEYAYDVVCGSSVNNNLAYNSNVYEVDEVYFINVYDEDTVKYMLQNVGEVCISIYANNANNNCFYSSSYETANHQVNIVGWDDNYSRTNFVGCDTSLPSANGAWIVKNSWGENCGDQGYYYLSYEDESLDSLGAVFTLRNTIDYENIYQYDGTTNHYNIYNTNYRTISWGNIYTAQRDEVIKEVGFYTLNSNVSYTIDVYRNATGADPITDATKVNNATTSGTLTYGGYHRIELANGVVVNENEKYSVVITLSTNSSEPLYFIADANYSYNFISAGVSFNLCRSISGQGQSYMKTGSSSWDDLYDNSYYNSARLKAYTTPANIDFDADEYILLYNEPFDISSHFECEDQNITSNMITWTIDDNTVVSRNNLIFTGLKRGSVTLTATLPNGASNSVRLTVKDKYTVDSNGVLVSYAGFNGDIVFDDAEITSIATQVFKNNTSIKSVDFGNNNITLIGSEAFSGCSNLKSINFRNNPIATICNYAFKGCKFSEFIIPVTVTSLGTDSFANISGCNFKYYCTSTLVSNDFTAAGIANPVQIHHEIHHDAVAATCCDTGNVEYYYCDYCITYLDTDHTTELTSVTLAPLGHIFDENNCCSRDGCGQYATSYYETYDGYLSIGYCAVDNTITIYCSEFMESDSAYSFDTDYNDAKLIFRDDTNYINCKLFKDNFHTNIVYVGENVSQISESALRNFDCCGIVADCNNAIYTTPANSYCLMKKSTNELIKGSSWTTIPQQTVKLCDYAFANVEDLTTLKITKNISEIGENVFVGCEELSSISLESGNANFISPTGSNAILKSITGDSTHYRLIVGCKNTHIPVNTKVIASGAFNGSECGNVTLIEGITTIEEGAFHNSDFTLLTLPATVNESGVSGKSFVDCNIDKIEISAGNNYLEDENCNVVIVKSTHKLVLGSNFSTIPSDVVEIGEYAFVNCNFNSIAIPNNVAKIDEYAFSGCTNLTSLIIPDTITNLSCYALNGSSITTLTIPITLNMSVESDGTEKYLDALKTFRSITNFNFTYGTNGKGANYSGETYKNTPWYIAARVKNISIYFANTITRIGDNMLNVLGGYNQTYGIISYNIPTSIQELGTNCFKGVNVPKNVSCSLLTQQQIETSGAKNLTLTHSIKYYAATAPTVDKNGNKEYYYCNDCGRYFSSDDCLDDHEITQESTVLAKLPYLLGDVNGDKRVTDADAIRLLMYAFFPDKYSINQPGDFTKDGRITDADAIYLLMYAFFPDKYPID